LRQGPLCSNKTAFHRSPPLGRPHRGPSRPTVTGARSVAASYKPPMLVTRVRLPACAFAPSGGIMAARVASRRSSTIGGRQPARPLADFALAFAKPTAWARATPRQMSPCCASAYAAARGLINVGAAPRSRLPARRSQTARGEHRLAQRRPWSGSRLLPSSDGESWAVADTAAWPWRRPRHGCLFAHGPWALAMWCRMAALCC